MLLLTWVLLGLAGGAVCLALERAGPARWLWIAAALPVGLHVAGSLLHSLRGGRLGVDVVALAAIVGSIVLDEAAAAAVIALMVAGGEALEAWAGGRATRALTDLVARAPRRAARIGAAATEEIDVSEIRPGDLLLIRPGDTIPADGTLEDAAATLDQSALTGESLPASFTHGAALRSGGVNTGSAFRLRAQHGAAESTYAAIIRLTQQAAAARAPLARLADQWALAFVGLTAIIGGGTWLATGEAVRALAVLVVATPCPLILAAPVALVAGIGRAARRGIVMKGGGALERLAGTRTMLFDKTGTLTPGRPQLTALDADPALGRDAALRLAAALAQGSSHPVSAALVAAARARGLALSCPGPVEEVPGGGLRGLVEGRAVLLGSESFLQQEGIARSSAFGLDARVATAGLVAWLAVGGHVAAAFVLTDAVRAEAPRTIRQLRALGVRRMVLVTGDHDAAALAIGRALRLDAVLADQTPAQKIAAVRAEAAMAPTAMVGDGVNDAPALAAAGVGIAMGAAGSAAATEAGDVVLLVDRVDRVAEALAIAQRSRRIALLAIALGMGASVVAMMVAAAGLLAPLAGALVQEIIDIFAILLALLALHPGREEQISVTLPAGAGLAERTAEHAELRRLAEAIRAAGEAVGPTAAALPQILALEERLRSSLLPHQQAEERLLYPAAARLLGGRDPMAPLIRMHAEIEALVERLAALRRLAEQRQDWSLCAPELRRALFALEVLLRVHLAAEEEVLAGLEATSP
ncbi:MAG TPA: heavy metal translocating P-type ATPase [Roseomonas sp.]|nr:heavy metal translocating P-type ATPase [Roseomonas sp.]